MDISTKNTVMHVCHRGWGVRTSFMRRLMKEARMKGGVILFRGSGAAARRYVEADRSRADEYYLGADDAVAEYAVLDASGEVTATRSLTAAEYERWVDWTEPTTGESMGTPRQPGERSKGSPLFAEMTINAPQVTVGRRRTPPRSLRSDRPGAAGRTGRDSTLAQPALRDEGRATRPKGGTAY